MGHEQQVWGSASMDRTQTVSKKRQTTTYRRQMGPRSITSMEIENEDQHGLLYRHAFCNWQDLQGHNLYYGKHYPLDDLRERKRFLHRLNLEIW